MASAYLSIMEIFLLQVFSSCFLCGLIWMVQIVHYPLLLKIPAESFLVYVKSHQQRISVLVVPLMLIELSSAILLMFVPPVFFGFELRLVNLGLLGIIWISTFAVQVPLHSKLALNYDWQAIQQLVRSNWIRTLAWTLKSLLLVWVIWRSKL